MKNVYLIRHALPDFPGGVGMPLHILEDLREMDAGQ